MAYDSLASGPYSIRSNYRLQLYVRRYDTSGNSSRYAWELKAYWTSGAYSGTWDNDCWNWSVNVEGDTWSGCRGLDFRGGNPANIIASGITGWKAHSSTGYLTVNYSASHNSSPTFGGASCSGSFAADRIPQVPGAPVPVASGNPDSITATSMRYRFAGPADNGGSTIDQYQVRYADNSSFSGATTVTSTGTTTATNLTPDTTYYWQSRAHNGVGWSAWSSTKSAKTLAVTAPGMTVSPQPIGSQTKITLVSPANLNPPDTFLLERRVQGSGSVTATSYPGSQTFPVTIGELTPGVTYEWRSAVKKGTYTSPYTDWTAAAQPAPNTNPGDYFDGATTAKTDNTYAWDGTANNSSSKAVGKIPLGWGVGMTASGGAGTIYRATGGRSGGFASKFIVFADSVNPGALIGTSRDATGRADVVPGGTYWGSIYVKLESRNQRMAAVIQWVDAGGTLIGTSAPGDAVIVVAAGDLWWRLSVQATAPAGAEFAAVLATDVAGSGWSKWISGETMLVDDAMINLGELYPYFDGDTPDTAEYAYAWSGAVDASYSTRTTLLQSSVDPFADPDCPPNVVAPVPPPVLDDCIDEIGIWRRYWAMIPVDVISRWLAVLPSIVLNSGAVASRQVRIRVYENPLGRTPDQFVPDQWVSEQIISYMPPNSQYVLDAVSERVRGTVDSGETWTDLDHLLYGTGGTPASWPILSCGVGYLISFDVPVDAPEGNLQTSVSLTRRF